MQGRKSLRKPANWQDFETLCKKLWGEIWRCPEIKKNGRAGQAQHGVDVYGVPAGEDGYYGIQCKGKDDYTNAVFTEKEVDAEIEKARGFIPALKKLYFATTANKDAAIEAYVRQRNLKNRAAGSFGIELFCWEDIVDLIDENKATHDWYVESQNYRLLHSAAVTFEDGQTSLKCTVPFRQEVKRYYVKTEHQRKLEEAIALKTAIYRIPAMMNAVARMNEVYRPVAFKPSVNHSHCNFCLKLSNIGSAPLKQFKVFLTFEGTFEKVSVYKDVFRSIARGGYDVSIDEGKRSDCSCPLDLYWYKTMR